MKTDLSLVALGMVASFFVSACGGSSDGSGSCGTTAACGGDIVGTWTITSSCLNASMPDMDCPGATIGSSTLKVTGTATYNADLTYSHTGTISGTAAFTIPASCLMSQGTTVTCDQLNQFFAAAPIPGVTIHCTGSTSCSCTETATNADASESGTYTVTAAGTLTETTTDGDDTVSDYCVKGTTLNVSEHSGGSETLTKS